MFWLCCAPIVLCSAQTLNEFSTANYLVYTDMPIAHVRSFATHMDKVFFEYKRRFEKLNLTARKLPAKMNLYLFESQDSYGKYLGNFGIPAQNTGGMFVVNPKINGLFTYIKDRPVRQTLSTLQHEGFHQFAFSYIGPDLPIWVNEGIAQFFEDGVLIKNRFVLDIANVRRLTQIKDAIANNRTLPFATLIDMTDKQWGQNLQQNQALASLQYDQAWSMVYFLINYNDKLLAAFNQYLIAVSKGVDSEVAFVNSFSLRSSSFAQLTADFETAWKRYITELEPNEVSQVADNMNFLANGLLWIRKANRPAPKSIEELRSVLQIAGYRITRTSSGVQTTYVASDESLYRYQLPNGTSVMLNLSGGDDKLPPNITAPSLKPSPKLVWYYMDKDLIYDVTYQ